MSVRYPIASNPEVAFSAPLGRATRQVEAEALAGEALVFVRELSGPAFATREAALAAYAGRLDESGCGLVQPEDRFCELIEVLAPGAPKDLGQARPTNAQGRRWPQPRRLLKTVWRLSVGYWKPVSQQPRPLLEQARQARRLQPAEPLDPEILRRLTSQPLKALKPQQPLDIGLFEAALPENPQIIIPDE